MSDLSPEERLEKHRAVAAWLEYQYTQERRKIRELEAAIAEQERRKQVAHVELRFRVEHTWGDEDPDIMHRGGCRVNRDPGELMQDVEAALIMRDRGDRITACDICNPLPALRAVYLTSHTPEDGA